MSTLATPTAPADRAEVSSAVLLLAVVQRVERLSPTFVRITFGGNGFENLGPAGHPLDQRLKLVFPLNGRPLDISRVRPQHWRRDWLALPEHERGHARTYTARRIVGTGTERQVVIDFVLHGVGDGEDGHTADAIGPASE